jgi:hypothetical protein
MKNFNKDDFPLFFIGRIAPFLSLIFSYFYLRIFFKTQKFRFNTRISCFSSPEYLINPLNSKFIRAYGSTDRISGFGPADGGSIPPALVNKEELNLGSTP